MPERSRREARQSGAALLFSRGCFVLHSGGDHGLKEGHHRPKIWTELFDGMRLLPVASGKKVRAALFVLFDPGFREAAVTNLRENLAHFLARLFRDDPRSGRVIALLGGVADGIAHVAEP